MTRKTISACLTLVFAAASLTGCYTNSVFVKNDNDRATLRLFSPNLSPRLGGLRLEGLFYQTAQGRVDLPAGLALNEAFRTPDGHTVQLAVTPDGDHYNIRLTAQPAAGMIRWGFAIDARPEETFTGITDRLESAPQPGDAQETLNLRGRKIQLGTAPAQSVEAPFYLSSRGYGLLVRGSWPVRFDFCASDPSRVKVEFDGPALDFKIYTAKDPAAIVQAHASDAGLPVLPPRWAFAPWRWRGELRNVPEYYDGTPVTGPYNAMVMEDILIMRAYGIPCGVYRINRPWGAGRSGMDDFEIDAKRLPEFSSMAGWMLKSNIHTVLGIGPGTSGQMAQEAVAKKYALPAQNPQASDHPPIDFTNPQARAFWDGGAAKLLKLGAAGFALDPAAEPLPALGSAKVFDGRTLAENRNDYPVQFAKTAYEIAKRHRGEDFVLQSRAAYSGSAPFAVFGGGGGESAPSGLRAAIVAAQRSAVMGYPFWGLGAGGDSGVLDRVVTARWLAFSCFTPLMEVGPTLNRAFWDMPAPPPQGSAADAELIAIWRLYARLRVRLLDYTYAAVKNAHQTGQPVIQPLFLACPGQAAAWKDWNTYLYGPDLLVSPVWDKAEKKHSVYLPRGSRWRYAWNPGDSLSGGQTIVVDAALHQVPLFIRDGAQVDVGDLNQEYAQSLAIAKKQPDIQAWDASVRAAFIKDHPLTQDDSAASPSWR